MKIDIIPFNMRFTINKVDKQVHQDDRVDGQRGDGHSEG
jgi:hypothetical protein